MPKKALRVVAIRAAVAAVETIRAAQKKSQLLHKTAKKLGIPIVAVMLPRGKIVGLPKRKR